MRKSETKHCMSIDVPTASYREETSAPRSKPRRCEKSSSRGTRAGGGKSCGPAIPVHACQSVGNQFTSSSRAAATGILNCGMSPSLIASLMFDLSSMGSPERRLSMSGMKEAETKKFSDTAKKSRRSTAQSIVMMHPTSSAVPQGKPEPTKHRGYSINGTCVYLPKATCLTFLDFSEKRLHTLPCPHRPSGQSGHGSGISYWAGGRPNPFDCVQVLHLSHNSITHLTKPKVASTGDDESCGVGKPIRLSLFKRVVLMDLSHNGLVSLVGVESMPSLRELQASHNNITNLIPLFLPDSLLRHSTGLQVLDVSFNAIKCIIPKIKGNEKSEGAGETQQQLLGLRTLNICNNYLKQLGDMTMLFPNLQKLRAVYNGLTEVPPLPKSLQYLVLQYNYLSKAEVRRATELRDDLPHLKLMSLGDQRVPGATKELEPSTAWTDDDDAGPTVAAGEAMNGVKKGSDEAQQTKTEGTEPKKTKEKETTKERECTEDYEKELERLKTRAKEREREKEAEAERERVRLRERRMEAERAAQKLKEMEARKENKGTCKVGDSKTVNSRAKESDAKPIVNAIDFESAQIGSTVHERSDSKCSKHKSSKRGSRKISRRSISRSLGSTARAAQSKNASQEEIQPVEEVDPGIVTLMRTYANRKMSDTPSIIDRVLHGERRRSTKGRRSSSTIPKPSAMITHGYNGMEHLKIASLTSLRAMEGTPCHQASNASGVEDGDVRSEDLFTKHTSKRLTPRVHGALGWNWLTSELQPPLRWGERKWEILGANNSHSCPASGRHQKLAKAPCEQ
uniref:Putative leucine-rich repeat protein (LRRP) n=1 Tax=Trypanosoma congolense (strain IL3000) TaxID=1068625 RepID=G0UN78_TRYCI|nr:putative leucine-rich repeat protein (LRRP) [Trypanosoma congolense IL3000]